MRSYDRPELDALRFLAFLMVFSFHYVDYAPLDASHHPILSTISTIGAFGVSLFFLLSSFLITELLQIEREATGRIGLRAFYARRALRIWPLYFAAFFGLAALTRFLPNVGPTDPASWLAFSTFVGNWYITAHGWIAGPVDPLWSISVEEQFYILIPMVIAVLGRKTRLVGSLLILGVAYCTIWDYARHPTDGDNGQWTNSFVQFQFFAAGTILSTVMRGRLPALPLPIRLAGIAAGPICWTVALTVFGVKSWDPHPTPIGAILGWLTVLAGTTIMFLSILGLDRSRLPRLLVYAGRISYGLYVFHSLMLYCVFTVAFAWLHAQIGEAWPGHKVENVTGALCVLGVSFLTAHLSYRYFEMPFLRLKRKFGVVQRAPTAANL